MAKIKKKEALSLERKIKQAFVPVDEQPYDVPENWCWVKLGQISDVKGGKRLPKGEALSDEVTAHPYIRVTDMKNGTIDMEDIKYVSDNVFGVIRNYTISNSDVYISVAGSIGKIGIIPDILDGAILTENAAKITNIIGTDNIFLKYYLHSEIAQLQMKESTISSTQPKLALFRIKDISVALPPLAEQQRIVKKIEKLFAELEEARKKLEEALGEIDKRTEIVLHNFFTAKYISDSCSDAVEQMLKEIFTYREQMISRREIQRAKVAPVREQDKLKCIPQNWKQVKLGEIAFVTKLSGFEYAKYIRLQEEGEIPVVRAQNVRKGYLNLNNVLYIDKKTSELLERSALKKKSLLITFVGAGIGDVCVFDKPERYHLAPNVAKIELFGNNLLNTDYIQYYLLSDVGQKEIFKSMKATVQPSLSMEAIRDIVIPIPELSIQNQIAEYISGIKEKELKEKSLIKNTLSQIELIKKSILTKAFRGELGTNNPDEESAVVLLKSILSE